MIGTLNVAVNAANPNIPLKTLFAYIHSPSSIRIIDVPKKIGKWIITQVYFTANYPDNRIVTAQCVLTGGCWTGTIVGSTVTGTSLNGYTISANGIDENGNPITGYVLGKGSVEILDADTKLAPTDPIFYIHVLNTKPENPTKGDAYVDGGVWYFYNGDNWVTLGGTFAGNGWAQYPESEGGDGKWHKLVISDGKISYEEDGVDEPDSEPFALKSDLDTEVDRSTQAEEYLQSQIDSITTELEDVATKSELSTETEARKVADEALQNNIDSLSASVNTKLTQEINRATGIENVISGDLEAAKIAINTNTQNITKNTQDIAAEVQRAKGVEGALSAAINTKADNNDVVKLNGNQTINGIKTFNQAINTNSTAFRRTITNSYIYMHGGTSTSDGATITLAGSKYTGTALPAGGVSLMATDGAKLDDESATNTSTSIEIHPDGYIKVKAFGPNQNPRIYGPQFAMSGMPSTSFVDLTLPNSGEFIEFSNGVDVAPWSGWLIISKRTSVAGQYLLVNVYPKDNTNIILNGYSETTVAGRYVNVSVPIAKGQRCRIVYIAGGEETTCRFSKAEAEVVK